MSKLLAVIKREYVQRVRTKFFVFMTILGPVMLLVFTVVPGLLLGMKTGDTRIAVVDQTEGMKLYDSVKRSLLRQDSTPSPDSQTLAKGVTANTNERVQQTARSLRGSFAIEQVGPGGRSIDELRRELNGRIGKNELDGYLIIPADVLQNTSAKVLYYGRNIGDVFTREQVQSRLNQAVRRERFRANGIREEFIDEASRPVEVITYGVSESGEEGRRDSGSALVVVFVIAFMIYISVLLYGQVVLGAVVEEKETRIAEVLFSSVRSMTLMVGKLIGVSLVALTQLGIWMLAFLFLSAYGLAVIAARGGLQDFALPQLPPIFFLYFFLFFIVGYFIYASLYVLVGSMVTTVQEGGQLAVPIVFLLMAGLYLAFPVVRSPNAPFAVWVSLIPFFSPITMVVRIVSQTPPFWQIALSLLLGALTVVLLLWLASRIYRIGMLMYGKRASIPEVARWLRQS